jgi:hypothetical protein
MKKSEKFLLTAFTFVFLILVGGGGVKYAYTQYMAIREENESLSNRIADMNYAISKGTDWAEKYHWLEENIPSFSSHEEASSKMLGVILTLADKRGLGIGGKEFIEESNEIGSDGLPVETNLGYFNRAKVKITITGALEKVFYQWLEDIQQAKLFIGVTHLLINPVGSNKTVNCEVEFTQFYRDGKQGK